jgi:hypothetical protein
MAVRAQQAEVLRAVIVRVSVDVVDLDGNLVGLRVTFAPSASAASFAKLGN